MTPTTSRSGKARARRNVGAKPVRRVRKGAVAIATGLPTAEEGKLYYRIGEVSRITGVMYLTAIRTAS